MWILFGGQILNSSLYFLVLEFQPISRHQDFQAEENIICQKNDGLHT